MDYRHLQNGSDIRGVALEGVAGENVTLTEDAVRHIARGFAAWLRKKTGKDDPCVSVGRDSRLSGESIAGWLTDELSRLGLDSADMGLATTPAMFMTTVTEGYLFDGAVMITASHLPWNRNGLKFFTAAGGAESADIREILAYDGPVAPAARPGRAEKGAFSPKDLWMKSFCARGSWRRNSPTFSIIRGGSRLRGFSRGFSRCCGGSGWTFGLRRKCSPDKRRRWARGPREGAMCGARRRRQPPVGFPPSATISFLCARPFTKSRFRGGSSPTLATRAAIF